MRTVRLAALAFAASLAGCATTVHFASEPSGATVSYRGQVLGKTPFDYVVHDQFGWFSEYDFTATLDGYQPSTLAFKERSPLDAQQVVPPQVSFTLTK